MQDGSIVLKATPLQGNSPGFVMASQSTARRAILMRSGIATRCVISGVDEEKIKLEAAALGLDVDQTVLALAEAKARSVTETDDWVLGADQMLVCDGRRFDKPSDLHQVKEHLTFLRGKTHILHTAMVLCRKGEVCWQHISRPALTMRSFSDIFLNHYIEAEGEVLLGCVGAYRLENIGAQLFEKVEGDDTAIMGLPILPLLKALRDIGYIES